MLHRMFAIFFDILAPMLFIVGLGALVHHFRAFQLQTMVRLNLYFFVPVFLFIRILESPLSWREIGGIGITVVVPMLLVGLPLYGILRRYGARGSTIAAMMVGGLLFNAGFVGIPVAELAYGPAGGQVQALVVMFINMMIFFVGYSVVALGQGHGVWSAISGYFRMPMIYAIGAALAMREMQWTVPGWIDTALQMIAAGMVPVALVTLGAQLAVRARWPVWRIVGPVIALKLLILPAVTAVVAWLLGLWPWPAAQLILGAATPTAINTLLLTIELDGDADTVAECVFWTTLASALTLTLTLLCLDTLGAGP